MPANGSTDEPASTAKRRPSWRLLAGAAVAVALLVGGVAVTVRNGQSEDLTAFCASVEPYAQTIIDMQGLSPGGPDFDFDAVSAALDRADAAYADMTEAAPGSLRDDLTLIHGFDADSLSISERERYEEARDRVNAVIADECDLAVSL